MLKTASAALALVCLPLAACSPETEENAEVLAERAAADTAANAEVAGERLREGAIVAADKVSEGAAQVRDDLAEQHAADEKTDGKLDGVS